MPFAWNDLQTIKTSLSFDMGSAANIWRVCRHCTFSRSAGWEGCSVVQSLESLVSNGVQWTWYALPAIPGIYTRTVEEAKASILIFRKTDWDRLSEARSSGEIGKANSRDATSEFLSFPTLGKVQEANWWSSRRALLFQRLASTVATNGNSSPERER